MKDVEWAPIRADVLALAVLLNGTCSCGRPNGRGRKHCCVMCAAGYKHGRLCRMRNGA